MLCNIREWLWVDISFTDEERDKTWRSHSWFIFFFIYVYQDKQKSQQFNF